MGRKRTYSELHKNEVAFTATTADVLLMENGRDEFIKFTMNIDLTFCPLGFSFRKLLISNKIVYRI